MYVENEYDWAVLKDYKKEKIIKLNDKIDVTNELEDEFQDNKIEVTEELSQLDAVNIYTMGILEQQKHKAKVKNKDIYLNKLNDDIAKATQDVINYQETKDKLKDEILEIEKKIRAIRSRKHAAIAAANSTEERKQIIEACPKKCKVSNITVACSHGRTMEVPPFEEGGDVPTLHVVSGSDTANKDIVTVKMAGSCDHGKQQTADDNDKFEIIERLVGNDQYCPSTKIVGNNNDLKVHRPSGVQFNAATNLKVLNTSPVYILLKRLVFGGDDDTTEYDISFASCKGNHPYKAKVIAHPKEEWKLNFSFGYKAAYENKTSQRKFGQDERVESYDAMTCNGKWEAVVEGDYIYDSVNNKVKVTLSLEELIKELGGSQWNYLAKLIEFFEPINSFFENAIGYSEGAAKKYDKTKEKADNRDKTIGDETIETKVDFEGPTIKIGGSYGMSERKELTTTVSTGEGERKLNAPLYDVGGTGELNVGFDPLLRVTGTLDILQYLMCTVAGPFGKYLKKISNMSMGKKEDDGSGTYIETKLALGISLTSSLAGNLVFECTEEKGWNASEKTSIGGFVGFELVGQAGLDGQVDGMFFKVTYGAGAEFKTTDESGGKKSGIEVNYKPTMIGNKFNWAGEFVFNGLAIIWLVYIKGGVDGSSKEKKKAQGKSGRLNKTKKVSIDAKKELNEKVDIFKKRTLFANDDAGSVNA